MYFLKKLAVKNYGMVILVSLFLVLSANPPTTFAKSTMLTAGFDTPLKAFEGVYQSKDDEFSFVRITAVDDKLVAKHIDTEQQFVLTRKSELAFETKDDDGDETVPIVFSKNDAGEVSEILVGGKQGWVKVKNYVPVAEVKLAPDQLKSFEGKYQFTEKKDMFLQITATPEGLLLRQLWDGRAIHFIAVSDNTFLNKKMGFPLKFTKNQDGRVIKVLAFNRDTWNKVE